jgi:hypothetical protein
MTSSPEPTSTRRHDLDALRAVAMLLGIVLHAALSFLPGPWMAQDSQQSVIFGLPIAAIHGFRMALFFLISGYFTALLWRKRGLRELIKQRFKRIFLPCMLGLVTIVPVTWVAIAIAVQGGSSSSATKGADDIWNAAVRGETDKVEHHLSQGTHVDQLHPVWGTPALTIAALHDRLEVVSLLLDKGADVNRTSRDGGTALHAAAFLGRETVVKLLLEKGADAYLRNQNGQTAQETMSTDWGTTKFIAGMLKLHVDKKEVTSGRSAAEKHFSAHGVSQKEQRSPPRGIDGHPRVSSSVVPVVSVLVGGRLCGLCVDRGQAGLERCTRFSGGFTAALRVADPVHAHPADADGGDESGVRTGYIHRAAAGAACAGLLRDLLHLRRAVS